MRRTALADAEHRHAESLGMLGRAAADASDAHDEQRLARQRGGEDAVPFVSTLAATSSGMRALSISSAISADCAALGTCAPLLVKHRHAGRNPVERKQIIDACAEDLQQLQIAARRRQAFLLEIGK